MMNLESIRARLTPQRLDVFGGFLSDDDPDLPASTQTLLLIGPAEPGFWTHFTASDEFNDGDPDPLDRWSRRILSDIAADIGALALFPFGGPPHRPFLGWALDSGRAWASPVGLLVHDEAGLMASYRGAFALDWQVALPSRPQSPCQPCSKPCATACPVGALTPDGYDTTTCRTFLKSAAGSECLNGGCLVRRACPVSQTYGRLPEQSAYHMRAFQR